MNMKILFYLIRKNEAVNNVNTKENNNPKIKEAQFGIFINNTSDVRVASCYTKPISLPESPSRSPPRWKAASFWTTSVRKSSSATAICSIRILQWQNMKDIRAHGFPI